MDPQDAHILVVDDFDIIRRFTITHLKKIAVGKVTQAASAEEAKTMIESGQLFNIIICDWNMGLMSGIDLLIWIRTDSPISNVPFIMLTGQGEKQNIIDAVKHGVTSYIVKPFSEEIIQSTVLRALGS